MSLQNSPKRVKNGDVFAINIGENTYAVGIVLNSSKLFKAAMLISFFDQVFSNIEKFDIKTLSPKMISDPTIDLPNYTGKSVLTKGIWTYLGNSKELLSKVPVPVLSSGKECYLGDEILSCDMEGNCKAKRIIGHGYLVVEDLLRDYFGRSA